MPVKNEALFRLGGYAAGFALLFAIWQQRDGLTPTTSGQGCYYPQRQYTS